MPAPAKKEVLQRAEALALAFVKKLKAGTAADKVADVAKLRAKEQYEAAEYIGRLAVAGKAQKVLNRVSAAVRAGELDATDLDREKLRAIMGEALQDKQANLLMRNMLSAAYNEGLHEHGATTESITHWLYVTAGDSLVRPSHKTWDGVLLSKSDPLVKRIFPPNGHNCRCRMKPLTRAEAKEALQTGEARKKPDTVPYDTYKDKVSGKTIKVVRGVDPGWNGLPSTTGETLRKLLERQIKQLQDTTA